MRSLRSLPVLAISLAAAVVLSACFVILSDTSAQLDVIGDVEVTTVGCFSGGTCPGGNANSPSGPNPQALIAYRVPDGVTAPGSLQSQEGLSLTRDSAYEAELQSLEPAPAGQHWVGYRSEPATSVQNVTVKPRFGLPQGAEGEPFQGPFEYRTVTGYTGLAAGTPVECGPNAYAPFPPGPTISQTICIDSPDEPTAETNKQQATRDLGITAAGTGSGRQNSTAVVRFTLVFAGEADPAAQFDLAASSDAPGVTLEAGGPLTPASDSTNTVDVQARIPATTPTGTYDVKLTASLPNGQKRERTGKLVVELGAPVNLTLPAVTGTGAVGRELTCERGEWSGDPTGFEYRWRAGDETIAGATGSRYTATEAEGAAIVTCVVTATNAAGSSTAKAGGLRVAQYGGADVDLNGAPVRVTRSGTRFVVDTGIRVYCPRRLPVNCGGSTRIDATVPGNTAQTRQLRVAEAGFAAATGRTKALVLRLSSRGTKTLRRLGSLRLTAEVRTRNHQLERVTSRKRFTARAPR